jgi:chaperonin GroEL (HSP60 family)
MLVDSLGDMTITNARATILKEIDIQHPAAKMLVGISKATDNKVGVTGACAIRHHSEMKSHL